MDLEMALLLGVVLVVLLVGWRMVRLESRILDSTEGAPGPLRVLQQEVEAMRSGVDERLREHLRNTDELSVRIGRLQEATRQVQELGAGLEELQGILRPPQLRGAFGEQLLEDALEDVLPRDRFRLQYVYPKSGVRVDVAIFLGGGRLLPIDSKFPLENYRRYVELRGRGGSAGSSAALRAFARDVRRHVDDVAGKYLSPADGATDLALLYIPAESVFQEIVVSGLEVDGTSLVSYALRRRVVLVSPNTLNAYLAVIRMGLRGYRLQERTREILDLLSDLQGDLDKLRMELGKATKQARHSVANLAEADAALNRLELRLGRLDGAGRSDVRVDEAGAPTIPTGIASR